MTWIQFRVTVPAESEEAVTMALLDIGCPGIEIQTGNPVCLVGAIPLDDRTSDRRDALMARLDGFASAGLPLVIEFSANEVDDAAWLEDWKRHYHTQLIGERLAIQPSWEKHEDTGDRVIVELDPGMAFGTGLHPTTRLCLEALEELIQPGMVVADVGTGSGILALSAARLGAGLVHATDIDSLPRKIARENVTANHLEGVVLIHEMDAFDHAATQCDLVVANIIADTLIELAPMLRNRLNPAGMLLACGIVEERLEDVLSAFRQANLQIVEVRIDEIWRLVIARPAIP